MPTFTGNIAGHSGIENSLASGMTDQSMHQPGGFIGTSPLMLVLYEHIQNAARSNAPVFITGESGTGKDLCAQNIHRFSSRTEKPFIPINCAAIPRDLLESELFGHVRGAFTGAISDRDGAVRRADSGTLFLDEIGEMDPAMQTKLLRFLQDSSFVKVGGGKIETVNTRIICATNRDPHQEIRKGRFREDLFYRLHVLPIEMPPLRQRADDILDIAQTLLLRYAAEENKKFQNFDRYAEDYLRQYNWPGNIRELQNVIRRAIVMHDGVTIRADMLSFQKPPPHDGPGKAVDTLTLGTLDGSRPHQGRIIPLQDIERQAIEQAIAICAGNIPRAAALLEISPSTIYRKKAGWALEKPALGSRNQGVISAPAE